MKKHFLLLGLILTLFSLEAQQVTILKPGAVEGKDASVGSLFPNALGDLESNTAYTWTGQGNTIYKQTLIQFDLSQIPEYAVITSVSLSLFYNPTDPYESFSTHTGDNDLRIRRITSTWDEQTVTWNSRPTATSENEVILPESSNNVQDYTGIDITQLIVDIIASSEGNNGLVLSMVNEQNPYRALLFASSDHPNSALHPELTVYWEIPDLDNDGFAADIDCNDENADINPSAMEIPNNGIDEDCDGSDLVSSTTLLEKQDFRIYPNPASELMVVEGNEFQQQDIDIILYNMTGTEVLHQASNSYRTLLDVGGLPAGGYLLEIRNPQTGAYGAWKVMVE